MDIEAQHLLVNMNQYNKKNKHLYVCLGLTAVSLCFSIIVTFILIRY
jgi:hypothetical protein